MPLAWSLLTATPSDEAVLALTRSWGWLLPKPIRPVLFSALGDVFCQTDSEEIWWINTGTAELTCVANSLAQFRGLLETELVDEWFLPQLIEQLRAAGKVLQSGQCYTYVILPAFAEGKYEVSNLNPVSACEHFEVTGKILGEINSLPDGSQVKLTIAK